MNLANKLSDGDQVYIPTKEETQKLLVTNYENSLQTKTSEKTNEQQRLISINSSPKEQLLELSGIGEVRANKIIENRPYGSIEELVKNGVISESIFDENKSKIEL